MESESKVRVAHFRVESELKLFFWACWSWESESGVRVTFLHVPVINLKKVELKSDLESENFKEVELESEMK